MISIDNILTKLQESYPKADVDLIKRAYIFAADKHKGQKRLSGDKYITHPLAVATILADLYLDDMTIAAALLHDTIEDSDVTDSELRDRFGEKVAELVSGVTTLGEIDFSKLPDQEVQEAKFRAEIENLRQFFLAIAKDIRVVLIKLADRLHNMRTLESLTVSDRKRISRETLEIFAPLADRLGMGQVKAELEDLAFKYSNPEAYKQIASIMAKGERERRNYLIQIKSIILTELEREGIKAQVDGRVKHLYSVYKKLNKVNQDFNKIYDLMAVRIVVDTVENCYKTMGIIHSKFKPMIYLIKDYIAIPKPNGYQSLHTTVFGVKGKITEIQIRTELMHEEAEQGVAAHWHYNESKLSVYEKGSSSFAPEERLGWVNKLANWQKNISSKQDFTEDLKIDLFNDRIFVFSPQGNIFDLPEEATPVDFAYEVHSTVGQRCRGAKVNGRIVPLSYQLSNRDVVEIILAPKNDKNGPARGWLEFVKTAKARQRIRAWFKNLNRAQNIEDGQKLLLSELKIFGLEDKDITEEQKKKIINNMGLKEWNDLLAAIGDGTITAKQAIKKIVGQKLYADLDSKKDKVEKNEEKTDGQEKETTYSSLSGILVRYADCCKPKKGDRVKGFITQGQGITIHKADCHSLLTSPQEKIIDVDFAEAKKILTTVEITGQTRVGLARDITSLIAKENIIIEDMQATGIKPEVSLIKITFFVDNPSIITDLLPRFGQIEGVMTVRRK
ncbi:MAG: bifunctional (p)ppGpp synthetase/guanosine-3',5'-bis(diphosphate) 3'-pyrophosphohydrolase [Patescibacteria group bacterium]|jgi:GTP pyrophosphokinase|nr:bifunctional (p)ppGpp synthetase/guanosine-3',5'-bis(diphosphate) 3'-pyrophosphohydrolase [Patescibacteria group bacterium]